MTDRSGETIEKFTLHRLLGEGGMGAVYLAQHMLTDRMVALKLLHDSFAGNHEILARIRREAKAAALIGHPNIVEIVDSGTDANGVPFIAMELLKGESLDGLLEKIGPMPIPLASYVICSILDTLQAAHLKGVVHRDMKPENVFLNQAHASNVPQVKILDFGISKFQSMDQQNMSLTRTGTVMGTPYYMSVEQAMGQKVDGRSDIYSVGVMLYQLLTARLPFCDSNYNRVLLQIVTGDFPPIDQIRPDLPPELVAIVHRAMSKNIEERYPDCHAFMAELQQFWILYDPAEIFSSLGDATIETRSVPLKTPTPQLTDPKLMAAAQTYGSPRVTTAAVGQSLETDSKKGMIAAILVLLVIGGGVGAYFMFKSEGEMKAGTPTAQNPEVPAVNAGMEPVMEPDMPVVMEAVMEPDMPVVMEAPLPAEIAINVVNVPKGASILLDGKKTTLPIKLPGARGQHSLVITAPGYEPFVKNIEYRADVHLVFDADRIQKVTVNSMKPPVDNPMEKPMVTPMETPMDMPSSMPVDVNRPDF
ncbi:protein kinase [Myxococcota bacterium]|nr:protein kinase [Myxococcota bacterium]